MTKLIHSPSPALRPALFLLASCVCMLLTCAASSANVSRQAAPCDDTVMFRTIDGTCTNDAHPDWGIKGSPQLSYFDTLDASTFYSPSFLRPPRQISNAICDQSGSKPNKRRLSTFTTFMAQFIDHSIFDTPKSEVRRDIAIPADDPYVRSFSSIEFSRSVSAAGVDGRMRPVNELSSALDLAAVYGASDGNATFLREGKYGFLKSPGGLMPRNDRNMFIAGDHRANENPVLTCLHIIMVREHNRLAQELLEEDFCSVGQFPGLDSPQCDEHIYQLARRMNSAQFQKVVYEEFFPALTGQRVPYSGYDPDTNPAVSVTFSTAAFRFGHSMVPDQLGRRGPGMVELEPLPLLNSFLRNGSIFDEGRGVGDGGGSEVDVLLRGAIYTVAEEVDVLVVSSLRNFLFHRDPEMAGRGVDLISLNIQRGRDHNLPAYNDIRERFTGNRAPSFAAITTDVDTRRRLESVYDHVDHVDAWVGLMAEDHAPGASFGRTMLAVWQTEFDRLAKGDRLHYRRDSFPPALRRYSRFKVVLEGQHTMKEIVRRNTDLTSAEIGDLWFATKTPFKDNHNSGLNPSALCPEGATNPGCKGTDYSGRF